MKRKKRILHGPDPMDFWVRQLAKEKKRRRNHDHGFSLVEIIIVIAIIAVLAAAVTPVLVRYIGKARKAIDIETAQTIFSAAELASASSNEDAYNGWYISAETSKKSQVGRVTVTGDGYNAKSVGQSATNKYDVAVVAWARGVNYNGWQNAQFKGVLDSNVGDISDSLRLQQAFTDEFMKNLAHNQGVSTTYKGAGKNSYDGHTDTTMEFRYKKALKYGKPECWILCINCTSYKPEVWIGDKRMNSDSTGGVRALYRLYPDPCDEYKN